MNANDFLELAAEEATGSREVDWRSATVGAYFAVFHLARKLLRQCGFAVPQAEGAHGYLWLRLSNASHPDIEQVGRRLRDLRGYRNQAHYEIDTPFPHFLAAETVHAAYDALKLLEEVLTLPTVLVAITEAVRAYERDILQQVTWQG
jgi:hypothetical protein